MGAFDGYLTPGEIVGVRDAMLAANLGAHSAQDAMLAGLLPAFAASLPYAPAPNVRLFTQLTLINRVPNLRNGDVPLAQYLGAALALAGEIPAADILDAALAKVNDARTGVRDAPAAPAQVRAANLDVRPEAYTTGIDATLPVKYLQGGARAAASVVKLLVHRHMDGRPEFLDGDEPRLFSGTGWIIGPGLLVTNHHVVNARLAIPVAEPDAAPQDFRLQAENMQILYDYLDASEPAASFLSGAGALVCADRELDFAILKVPAGAPERPPLRLRQKPISKTLRQALGTRVNVLQHPNGNPMRLGFRNNFVVLGTDATLSYLTDTAQGSSGSPVCDDLWAVAAIHCGSRSISDRNIQILGRKVRSENYGTPVPALMEALRLRHPAVYESIRAGQA